MSEINEDNADEMNEIVGRLNTVLQNELAERLPSEFGQQFAKSMRVMQISLEGETNLIPNEGESATINLDDITDKLNQQLRAELQQSSFGHNIEQIGAASVTQFGLLATAHGAKQRCKTVPHSNGKCWITVCC